jgi:hypothetical protein
MQEMLRVAHIDAATANAERERNGGSSSFGGIGGGRSSQFGNSGGGDGGESTGALRADVKRLTAAAAAAESAKLSAERAAAAATGQLKAAEASEAAATERAKAAEGARAGMVADAEAARASLLGEIAALEAEVARATAARWGKELDAAVAPAPRAAERAQQRQHVGANSQGAMLYDDDDFDAAEDYDDFPTRLVSMLDVDQPAWSFER